MIALEDVPQRPEAESRPVLNSVFDVHVSDKLPPGYTEQSMANKKVSCSSVLNCSRLACLGKLGTDDQYVQVTTLLCTFLFPNFHV